MKDTVFIRLLQHEDKGEVLTERVSALRQGEAGEDVYAVNPESFRQVPNTPFCYWVSDRIRRLFKELPPFESEGRTVKVGLQTSDDFRFVRAWWEVPPERILDGGGWEGFSNPWKEDERNKPEWTQEKVQEFQKYCLQRTYQGKRWVPFAKGGEYSPYYSDIHLVVNWENNGEEIRNFCDPKTGRTFSRPQNTDYYFRPGLTWPERTTSGYAPQVLPAGTVFSVTGQAMFMNDNDFMISLLAVHNTRAFQYLEELQIGLGEETVSGSAARHYTGGSISRLPCPIPLIKQKESGKFLSELASIILENRRNEIIHSGTSLLFSVPIEVSNSQLTEMMLNRKKELLQLYKKSAEAAGSIEKLTRVFLRLREKEIEDVAAIIGPHPVIDLVSKPIIEIEEDFKNIYMTSIDSLIDNAVSTGKSNRWITKKSFFVCRLHELFAQWLDCNLLDVLSTDEEIPQIWYGVPEEKTRGLINWILGIVYGRWDVRISKDPSLAPELPDPFDPLPVCPPGMLVGPDGLPAEPNRIVSEEWLRARPDANTLPPEGSVKNPTIPDSEYPLRIFWDGILVDDPGLNGAQPHREDIVRRVREVLELLWKDKAHEIEQEACEILGVSELRDYFRKPSGFFQDHLKRYSKSRRKAPIYWPLSTASGSYTVWVYYQRLTDQTLYSVVNKFVEPKIDEVERGVGRIENEKQSASGREAVRLNDLLKEYRSLLSELQDFREELLRIAELPYKPDLNDGVIINAGPFHKLFRLRSWAKETEDCWKKLEKGGYDWSHVAYTIWPERVRKVCRKDRSIALAHGLEDVCEAASPSSKKRTKRSRRSGGGKG